MCPASLLLMLIAPAITKSFASALSDFILRPFLCLSIINGLTWTHIETLQGNPGTHDWRVPVLNAVKSKCRVKVVLRDADGRSLGSDTSDAVCFQ